MALLNFFKVPKNQKFDYKPRYWNQKKEELEERMGKYKPETRGDAAAVKSRLAKGFRKGGGSYRVSSEIRAKEMRRSNMVLLAVIIGLVFIAYVLFEIYMPDIIKMVE